MKTTRQYGGGHHGRERYWIEGEGCAEQTLHHPPYAKQKRFKPETPDEQREFRFCRMFPSRILKPFTPPDAALIALAQVMEDPAAVPNNHPDLPAGFTYFGQFVDHDITMDRTEGFPAGALDPADIESGRSPALDLDSVYGRGPQHSPELFESDKVHLKIGTTTGRDTFGVTGRFPNDLPRDSTTSPRRAVIGDPRNDENLAVAQTHLSFLKFHNKIVDANKVGFEAARKVARQHYQWMVLRDYVPQFVERGVYDDILRHGRQVFLPRGVPKKKHLCMPVEFSVAAFRLGHSMIRNEYEWNRIFRAGGPGGPATLPLLFRLTAVSGNLGDADTLPSDWIIDWTRFHDFSGVSGVNNNPVSNRTRLIDTRLADALMDLPEFAGMPPHLRSLAARNLLRGKRLGLPGGQAVARRLKIRPLTRDEVSQGKHEAAILAGGFDRQTPLWYYILKEAEARHGGRHLGEAGSRIVVETFHALIEGSQDSILRDPKWAPSLPSASKGDFTVADMLAFVGDLNPLGN